MDLTLCSASEECIHKDFCQRSTLKEVLNTDKKSCIDFNKIGCQKDDYDMMIPDGWTPDTEEEE